MGFIKHALIGIALYEVGKYIISSDAFRSEDILSVGANPDTPLNGNLPHDDDDPWKNSLANDELRAPDA